uniref:GST N-terminal domain-containing protein n=1 Tax=Saimiri boliviensis boliviensis TaxID=39432 RepID=A0A2K6T7G1_SAIBB
MPMTMGYWDIHGLARAICLLLEYTDSSYKEKKYRMGDAPDYDRSQWLNENFRLGLDFPSTTCVGRQQRRRFGKTFWRTRLYTTACSWPDLLQPRF